MEKVEDGNLDVDQEMELLGEGREGPIAVCDCFEEIVDPDGGVGRFGGGGFDALVIDLPAFRIVDDILVS